MIEVVVALLFQAAGGPAQVASPVDSGVDTGEEVTVTGKLEQPKVVCRTEFVTGSRVKKERICAAPANKAQDTQTNLQRQMSRNGDVAEPSESNQFRN